MPTDLPCRPLRETSTDDTDFAAFLAAYIVVAILMSCALIMLTRISLTDDDASFSSDPVLNLVDLASCPAHCP